MLRCLQIGIPLRDLSLLTIGMVLEIYAEGQADGQDIEALATQEDFDAF